MASKIMVDITPGNGNMSATTNSLNQYWLRICVCVKLWEMGASILSGFVPKISSFMAGSGDDLITLSNTHQTRPSHTLLHPITQSNARVGFSGKASVLTYIPDKWQCCRKPIMTRKLYVLTSHEPYLLLLKKVLQIGVMGKESLYCMLYVNCVIIESNTQPNHTNIWELPLKSLSFVP